MGISTTRFWGFVPLQILLIAIVAWPALSSAGAIDLSTFMPDPAPNVTIAADGSSAVMTEDTFFFTSLQGDVTLPLDAAVFQVDYELSVPLGNEDFFDLFVGDLSTPAFSTGGPGADVFAGTATVDVAALAGTTIPAIFDLIPNDFEFDSVLTISNPRVSLATVATPAPLLLLLAGFYGLRRTLRQVNRTVRVD